MKAERGKKRSESLKGEMVATVTALGWYLGEGPVGQQVVGGGLWRDSVVWGAPEETLRAQLGSGRGPAHGQSLGTQEEDFRAAESRAAGETER